MKKLLENQRGITLIILVVTIIVMIILAAISIKQGLFSVSSTQDSVIESNLKVVQQAVMQEYTKSKTTSEGDGTEPNLGIGEQQSKQKLDTLLSGENINLQNRTEHPDSYFLLDKGDLDKLGVEVPEGQEYLVDYKTGEIWDVTNKKYKDDTYAYLSGVTNELINDSEKFSDANIEITVEEDWQKKGSEYVLKLKVKDDNNKVNTDQNPDNGLDKKDLDTGKLKIEIDNKTPDGTTVTFTPSPDPDDKYIYDVEIKIPSDKIDDLINGTDPGAVKVEITPNAIIDEGNNTNEDTIISSVIPSDKGTGTITWALNNLKYETKIEDCPDGYTQKINDKESITWGTGAVVDLILKTASDRSFDNNTYTFLYTWGTSNPDWSNPQEAVVTTKKGEKIAKASIYVNEGTGKGRIYVKPAKPYSGMSQDLRSIPVNLDNTPPKIEGKAGENITRRNFLGIYDEDIFSVKNEITGSTYHLFKEDDMDIKIFDIGSGIKPTGDIFIHPGTKRNIDDYLELIYPISRPKFSLKLPLYELDTSSAVGLNVTRLNDYEKNKSDPGYDKSEFESDFETMYISGPRYLFQTCKGYALRKY